MTSYAYATSLMDAEGCTELDLSELGWETLFSEPSSESEELILLDASDRELESLSGEETEEIIKNYLDISDSTVQNARVSSTSSVSPPTTPGSVLGHTPSRLWELQDPVSSTCTPPNTPIVPKQEMPWGKMNPSPKPADSSYYFSDSTQWQKNIKFDETPCVPKQEIPWSQVSPDSSCRYNSMSMSSETHWHQVAEEHDRCCMPPSPDSFNYGYNVPRNVRMLVEDNDEKVKYEEWTTFDHVRPDGECDCKVKKNLKKCLAQKSRRRRTNQLWHFLLDVLNNPEYSRYIRWLDRQAGVFRFEQSQKVAKLWGDRKQKKNMSYEYMSRAMRHYYIQGIMRRVGDKRLTYQFGPNAENWKRYAKLQQ